MGLQPKCGANPYRYNFLFPELERRKHLAHAAVEARVASPQRLTSLLELPRAPLPELLRTAPPQSLAPLLELPRALLPELLRTAPPQSLAPRRRRASRRCSSSRARRCPSCFAPTCRQLVGGVRLRRCTSFPASLLRIAADSTGTG
ncbi:hypothetical protein GUJ93_ZPchr0012g22042 [Zizania palustris]|uniref:Uncharacterized protein n=1 Tax=Zizania palustris TaxID=103762 RepID=A0A8J5WUD7_ZIZPA|nr:hypothetical protein GUJ93_ZPchr0012g22042 [Zizania palustris]